MNKKTARHITSLLAALGIAFGLAAAGWAAQGSAPQSGRDEFFIVTSLNVPKHQIVLKLPTEVTLRMNVNDKTRVIGEDGKTMPVAQLQAGDTAYITYAHGPEGPMATLIRLGPMTWSELQRRYLGGGASNQPPPLAPIVKQSSQTKQSAGGKSARSRRNFPRHSPQSHTP